MVGRFKALSLCNALNKYSDIIVYGAGNYAKEFYPYFVAHNIKHKIKCFTQSNISEEKFFEGIPIVAFKDILCDKDNCAVFVAVSELYSEEIRQILVNSGYVNIFLLTDYIIDYKYEEKKFYLLKNFAEYCSYIADWYVETHTDNIDKKTLEMKLVTRGERIVDKRNLNIIVLICGNLSARITKIIGALKRKGFYVIVLGYWYNAYLWALDELEKIDVSIYYCSCIQELFYKMLQYNPLVYVFEPRWGDCLWAEVVIKNKTYFGKIAISLYDVMNDGYIADQSADKLKSEKYVLENADGIVWRWFSKEHLEGKGFIFRGKSIQFLDCCNIRDSYTNENKNLPSIVRLCEVSGIGNEYVEKKKYNSEYQDFARIGEILEKVGNRKDCIFHFYAGELDDKNVEICEGYKEKYDNFDYFLNTKHDELIRCLEQYDYGCDFYTGKLMPSDDTIVGRRTGSTLRNCSRNILFDYISAGIPIITTFPQKLLEHLDQYDVVVKMDLVNLDMEFLVQTKEYYKQKAVLACKKLNIDNQIIKLINFLKSV